MQQDIRGTGTSAELQRVFLSAPNTDDKHLMKSQTWRYGAGFEVRDKTLAGACFYVAVFDSALFHDGSSSKKKKVKPQRFWRLQKTVRNISAFLETLKLVEVLAHIPLLIEFIKWHFRVFSS